jgi:hypothetical protein
VAVGVTVAVAVAVAVEVGVGVGADWTSNEPTSMRLFAHCVVYIILSLLCRRKNEGQSIT